MKKLTSEILKEISQQLQSRREDLLTHISAQLSPEGRERLRGVHDSTHDQGDESVAALLADLGIATIRAEAAELSDIEGALNRINNHTFGVCVDCGKEIAPARLQAYPTAKRCLACQQQYEDTRGGKDSTPSL